MDLRVEPRGWLGGHLGGPPHPQEQGQVQCLPGPSRRTGFFLSAGLCKAPLVKQAARILALWNGIETFAERARPGSMFALPLTSTRIGTL
jgi:hypothetical protein